MEERKRGTQWGLLEAVRKMKEEEDPSMNAIKAVYSGGCKHRIDLIGQITEGAVIDMEGEKGEVNKAIGSRGGGTHCAFKEG